MTLSQYLALTGLTQQQFGRLIGVTQITVSRYVHGLRIPRVEHLRRIAEVTQGAVMPEDFVFQKVNGKYASVNGKYDDAA